LAYEEQPAMHLQVRRRALGVAAVGLCWIGGGILAISVGRIWTGAWDAAGPLAWLFVVYGTLRVLAGLITAANHKPGAQASRSRMVVSAACSLIADHQLLGLRPGASWSEVHGAYRELVKVWHPDRFASAPDMRTRAELRLKAINAAYARLREGAASGDDGGPV
jgi:hypothetical protein